MRFLFLSRRFPDVRLGFRHQSELSERHWENAVQGLGKENSSSYHIHEMCFFHERKKLLSVKSNRGARVLGQVSFLLHVLAAFLLGRQFLRHSTGKFVKTITKTSRLSLIVRVNVVMNRTVVVDSD